MAGRFVPHSLLGIGLLMLAASGCNSPYRSDRGALAGGLGGAGVGAIIGHAVGNTGAGAAIGAATGAIAGGAIGAGLDDIEARNRAEIEARIGRPVARGTVTIPDVVAMTQAGVSEDVIISHVQANGFASALQSSDIIYLQQHGVTSRVMQTLQSPRPGPVMMAAAPVPVVQPVIVEEYYYAPPPPRFYHHYHHRHRHHHPHHGVSWGVSVSH